MAHLRVSAKAQQFCYQRYSVVIQGQVRNLRQLEGVGVITECQDTGIWVSAGQEVPEPQYATLIVSPRSFPVAIESVHGDDTARRNLSAAAGSRQRKCSLDNRITPRDQFLQTESVTPSLDGDVALIVVNQCWATNGQEMAIRTGSFRLGASLSFKPCNFAFISISVVLEVFAWNLGWWVS